MWADRGSLNTFQAGFKILINLCKNGKNLHKACAWLSLLDEGILQYSALVLFVERGVWGILGGGVRVPIQLGLEFKSFGKDVKFVGVYDASWGFALVCVITVGLYCPLNIA